MGRYAEAELYFFPDLRKKLTSAFFHSNGILPVLNDIEKSLCIAVSNSSLAFNRRSVKTLSGQAAFHSFKYSRDASVSSKLIFL